MLYKSEPKSAAWKVSFLMAGLLVISFGFVLLAVMIAQPSRVVVKQSNPANSIYPGTIGPESEGRFEAIEPMVQSRYGHHGDW